MAISLKESRVVAEMAELLYDFLPGSGLPIWKGHVSFKTVSEKVGVGDFWQPGSKTPMITSLLERTLEFRRGRFEPLILEIVRAGLSYRQKQGNPVKPEEIDKLNENIKMNQMETEELIKKINSLESKLNEAESSPKILESIRDLMVHKGFISDRELDNIFKEFE